MPDPLEILWERIHRGQAEEQEKIDTAVLTGTSGEARFVPHLRALLDDDSSLVRYYALQSLVLDLQQKNAEMAERCWNLLGGDPDESVRGMAAACIGSMHFGRRSIAVFRRLVAELKNPSQPPLAKSGIYNSLFELAGRPPSEWPGLQARLKLFEESDIDWEKVAWLEDQMTEG